MTIRSKVPVAKHNSISARGGKQLKSRCNIVMATVPERYHTGFKALDKEEFNTKAKGLCGEDLKKFITDRIEETTKSVVALAMVDTGKFLGLEDITAKHTQQPARFSAILKNTKKSGRCR